MNNLDLHEIGAEIGAISMIITGLANQCDDSCDSLTDESLRYALFGVTRFLNRIEEDIDRLNEPEYEHKFNSDIVYQLEVIADEANDKIMISGGKEQYWDGYEDGIAKAIEVIKAGAQNGSV